MRGIVPTQILERKDKIGFETPELEWMKLLKPDIEVWLEGLSEIPWINVPTAKIYFKELIAGKREFAGLIWRLINTARWTALVQRDSIKNKP
jgi:asparagine synthase (glutamine-hydrolysing)